jgi:ERO1-like protein alpha
MLKSSFAKRVKSRVFLTKLVEKVSQKLSSTFTGFTGYQGQSARRIWKTIYDENCFKSQERNSYKSVMRKPMSRQDGCLEERVFYRMISGLHASINIHLCANYLQQEKSSPMGMISPSGMWGPNLKEFIKRFSPETTNNQGEDWLRNLYFTFLVELRAIAKVAPYLKNWDFYTGVEKADKEIKLAVTDLLNVIESFPSHFDESIMFYGHANKLKNEFREKFLNITRIMDCVGCDKCRLWGKLQTQGMGTALKILFSGKFEHSAPDKQTILMSDLNNNQFKMKRTEIVALFNAFGRYSKKTFVSSS